MVDASPPAPPAPQPLPVMPPSPPEQLPVPPVQPILPPAQSIPTQPFQPAPMPQLNWSYVKPEVAGKPDENAKAHLLRTNDWMDTHAFPEGLQVQCFCLTIIGEARAWYESLRPINVDCNGL